jgi:hypothetical protein
MKMNAPTHEEVTQRAQELWQARGSPGGRDTEIWLEAERQLLTPTVTIRNAPSATLGRGNGNSQSSATAADPKADDLAAGHSSGHAAPGPSPGEITAKTLQRKKEARSPQFPDAKSAHPPTPPQSGKPIWDKPHSK